MLFAAQREKLLSDFFFHSYGKVFPEYEKIAFGNFSYCFWGSRNWLLNLVTILAQTKQLHGQAVGTFPNGPARDTFVPI